MSEAHWRVPTLLLFSGSGMATGGWLAGYLYDIYGYYIPAFGTGVAFNIANIAILFMLLVRQRTYMLIDALTAELPRSPVVVGASRSAPCVCRSRSPPACSPCRPRRNAQTFKSSAGDLKVETVAGGLSHPWALAFLPDGRMLVTERPGRMRIATPTASCRRRCKACRRSLPPARAACSTSCSTATSRSNKTIYFCFAEPERSGARTAMARATLARRQARRRQGDLPPGRPAVERQSFRLPHRAERRQQSVPDHGRALHRPRRGAEADQPSRQDRADQARRLGAGRQSVRRPQGRQAGNLVATATATRRARRSIPSPASSGSTSTAPRAATRSTFRSPARTTAGR